MDLIAAALLLVFLLASTLGWAIVYSRRSVDGHAVDEGLARTRLWASAVPLGIIVVLIAASFLAVFSAHPISGIQRLRYALGMWPTVVGLVLCAIAAVIPCVSCIRAWRTSGWTAATRVHISVFLVVLVLVIIILLSAGNLASRT